MSDIQQRDYYKIFTGTNQTGGYDNVHLGYEAETSEVILKKDQTTYFHIPFFASVQPINESTLVADGATPGPIPALADRIMKKLGGYGDTTPWGYPSERTDGTWLCSWLYALSSESPQWLDRYYNPGRLSYEEALEGRANYGDYIKNDPIYYDTPSTLTLEPGVYYQYYHNGEKSATEQVKTFSGDEQTRLKLSIEDWSATPLDNSLYNNKVSIANFKPSWVVDTYDPGYQDRNSLSFDNTDFIDCKVNFNTSYNKENEFTLSFWVYNKDWSKAVSTQFVGNLRKGGYSVFYNNLNYNPYFVIPENTYGHLFYFNQDGNSYYDKNIPNTLLGQPGNPASVNINSNAEIVCLETANRRIYKYNHVGDLLAQSPPLSGTPYLSIIDQDDSTIVVTNSGTSVYDKNLSLITSSTSNVYGYNSLNSTPIAYKERIAFNIEGVLVREPDCRDIIFDINNNKWTINVNGILQKNNISFTPLVNDICTKLAIDPENKLWVLTNTNKAYKIDTDVYTVSDIFEIGTNVTSDIKNISFIKNYNRKLNTQAWFAYVYIDFEQMLYKTTLQGKTVENIFLPQKLNNLDPLARTQNSNLLSFTGKGDFTGYEWRRIFNNIFYKNKPQIQFKLAVNPQDPTLPNSVYSLSVPVDYLLNEEWHLVTATFKNHETKIYIDNFLRDTLPIPGSVDLNYEFKNDLYIGCPCGKSENLNTEINSNSIIWNGYIDSIRIYDYAIEEKYIPFFVREKINATDIEWNIPTAALQYVEVVDRFFKHRTPGSKSVFFNIRLTGTSITDPEIRRRIENDIKLAVQQIKPAYTELLKIEWVE